MSDAVVYRQVVAGVLMADSQVLIGQRRDDQSQPGAWEFPGGKVEASETLAAALTRELEEELGVRAIIGEKLARVRHVYADGAAVELHFFAVHEFRGELENRIYRALRWCERRALVAAEFLAADRGVVEQLRVGRP